MIARGERVATPGDLDTVWTVDAATGCPLRWFLVSPDGYPVWSCDGFSGLHTWERVMRAGPVYASRPTWALPWLGYTTGETS